MKTTRTNRRGVTLVLVIAALMMILLVSAALVRLAGLQRERAGRDADLVEASWLAEAGLERAWVKLQDDPDYDGETWEIEADDLGGRPATVRIAVATADAGEEFPIQIKVEYPAGAAATVRITRTFPARRPAGRPGGPTP